MIDLIQYPFQFFAAFFLLALWLGAILGLRWNQAHVRRLQKRIETLKLDVWLRSR